MEENEQSKDKPFSVLERFRQLKKEKEHELTPSKETNQPKCPGTVFQASTSLQNAPTEHFERGDSSLAGRGRTRGKRRFNEDWSERPKKKVVAELHQGQKESDVGITEYIRTGPGFEVIIKHRFTDFHVNEIDLQGRVVKLTSREIPTNEEKAETVTDEEDPTILTPEQWDTLREIAEKKLISTLDIDVTDYDKFQRQKIHKAVKKRFGVQMFSNTKDINSRKVIKIGCASGQPNYRFCSWPKERAEYLHFVLFKENCDMHEVGYVLSKFTSIKATKFGYAGTKDKRGVTTQQVCVRRGEANRFKNCDKMRGMAVGNFCYKWNKLRLGDLRGNRFKMVLRHIKASDEVVQNAIDQFQRTGFINYFGLQRFGQSALVPTYFVGKAILKGDWKLATELILKPRPGESCFTDIKEAREKWWETKDANEALKKLSRKEKSIEGKILVGLKRHGPNAYQNAFDNLPTHIVTMYLHSYQSLIWNKVVSRRVREFGLKVLPGDLVRVNPLSDEHESSSDSDDEEADVVPGKEEGFERRVNVRTLSKEDAEGASVYDLVYPLPGDDVRLPSNETATWYTELLQEDGFSMDCFRMVNKKYGMYGSYRQMMERAEEFSWRPLRYSDPDEILLLSDLEKLKGTPPLVHDPEGPYKALILEFNLKVCCYATMAIRELTKCETSSSSQAMLTNRAREDYQTFKREKMEDGNTEQKQDMEIECVPEVKNTNGSAEEQSKNCNMETEPSSTSSEVEAPQQAGDVVNGGIDEVREMNKREAEADNIINKYLESAYH